MTNKKESTILTEMLDFDEKKAKSILNRINRTLKKCSEDLKTSGMSDHALKVDEERKLIMDTFLWMSGENKNRKNAWNHMLELFRDYQIGLEKIDSVLRDKGFYIIGAKETLYFHSICIKTAVNVPNNINDWTVLSLTKDTDPELGDLNDYIVPQKYNNDANIRSPALWNPHCLGDFYGMKIKCTRKISESYGDMVVRSVLERYDNDVKEYDIRSRDLKNKPVFGPFYVVVPYITVDDIATIFIGYTKLNGDLENYVSEFWDNFMNLAYLIPIRYIDQEKSKLEEPSSET